MEKGNLYPALEIVNIKNPNKFYAFPLIGFLAKIILLIPVYLELIFLYIGLVFVLLIGSFVVLFTDKYWQFGYRYNLGLMRLIVKTRLYFYGLTDKYPYFNFQIDDSYSFNMQTPSHPSKLFAVPLAGGLIRLLLLIPYLVFVEVIAVGAALGYIISFYNVLSIGDFPEATFEFIRDSVRVTQAAMAYFFGLSDDYPSFYISLNHQNIKIALIIAGILLTTGHRFTGPQTQVRSHPTPAPIAQKWNTY